MPNNLNQQHCKLEVRSRGGEQNDTTCVNRGERVERYSSCNQNVIGAVFPESLPNG